MKPILFNTDMVRAILEDRKTVTRRVVKPQLETECSHGGQHKFIQDDFIEGTSFTGFVCRKCGYGVCWPHFKFPIGTSWIRPPYRPGDILYVRETWAKMECSECSVDEDDCESSVERNGLTIFCNGNMYVYKATDLLPGGHKWRPSIHMPREAARIFLRVTDVRVERLQEITNEQAQAEGVKGWMVATDRDWDKNPNYILAFRHAWNSTIKKADRARYGWDANPWVFVISFERISKDEALQ